MFVIFKLILSLCSVLIIGVYYLIIYRTKDYSKNLYFKRAGILCSKCTAPVITEDDFLKVPNLFDRENNLVECKSCRRESRLNLLVSFGSIKDKFDRWILTKKSEKILLFCIFIPLPLVIASIFIANKPLSSVVSIFNSSILITYWLLMIYRVYLCRKPLPDTLLN